jgi:hypothetical protein
MAPFYVDRSTDTYAEHPDWWVTSADGVELTYTNAGTGNYAVIDATHPEAGPWMAAQVRARVDEGYGYLKLDFLYAGAEEGVRYADVTGVEAYHIALELLREAAGDAWVLACGAPMLPSVGFAESFRSGADIAFEVSPDPAQAFVRWQARQTGARSWAHACGGGTTPTRSSSVSPTRWTRPPGRWSTTSSRAGPGCWATTSRPCPLSAWPWA